MDDAFEAPGGDQPPTVHRHIDVRRAVVDGVSAGLAARTHVAAILVGGLALYFVSVCSCVLWIATWPMAVWGLSAWAIGVVDGRPDLSNLWKGATEDFVTVWMRGWGWSLVMLLIAVPLYVVMGAVFGVYFWQLLESGNPTPDPATSSLVSIGAQIPAVLYQLLTIRFTLSVFYVAEHRARVIEAVSRSWEDTATSWGGLVALVIGWFALAFPLSAVSQYANYLYQSLPVGQQLEYLGPFYAAMTAMGFINVVISMFALLVLAAGYRQLYPQPPAERA